MIRFLLDFQTTNIVVITDSSIQTVDFYYIADFLEIEKNEEGDYELSIRDIFKDLLKYWKFILSENSNEVFLIYDLSDQYISSFYIEKYDVKGREYLQITKKSTQELAGWSVTKNTSLLELKSRKWEVDNDFSLQGNRKSILRGLDWSIENLRINTNPVNFEK
ncbi:hypothetical protein GCM10028807_32990 [Spirosoma daeguense]